ncbi:unnamed protein product, partial [Ectocarpus sp. 12 AP-2014]
MGAVTQQLAGRPRGSRLALGCKLCEYLMLFSERSVSVWYLAGLYQPHEEPTLEVVVESYGRASTCGLVHVPLGQQSSVAGDLCFAEDPRVDAFSHKCSTIATGVCACMCTPIHTGCGTFGRLLSRRT